MNINRSKIILPVLALCIVIIFAYLILEFDIIQKLKFLLNEKTPAWLFIVLMTILPLLGFPFSGFLILSGIKFGIGGGILITATIMPIQLIISYIVVNSYLKVWIMKIAAQKGIRLPEIPDDKIVFYSFIFMATPGLSYALKNYLLPLSGVSFKYYVISGYLGQGLIAMPFIVLGESALAMNYKLFLLFLAVFIVISLLVRWIRRKYGSVVSVDE